MASADLGLDAPDAGAEMQLKSKDGKSLGLPRKYALLSGLVKAALESGTFGERELSFR